MKTSRIILCFPLALLRLTLVLAVTIVIGISGLIWCLLFGFSRQLQQWSMQTWGRLVLAICGISVQKNEIPANSQFIMMPNHRSYIDIFILAAYTPAAFVAKAEIKSWPMVRAGARITGIIFVSRSDQRSLVATMNNIKTTVEQGIPVIIFPEGTTTRGPLTRSFKKGSFKIAAETGIPIIPVAFHYIDPADAWVDNDTFLGHFLRQMGKPVTRVLLHFGEPVISGDYKQLLNTTKKQIDDLLQQMID